MKLPATPLPLSRLSNALMPQVMGNMSENARSEAGMVSHGITTPEKNKTKYSRIDPTRFKTILKDAMKTPKA
jgi:hypothetical protein